MSTKYRTDSYPYKIYTAQITQIGSNPPTVVSIGENTIGNIVWTRSSDGIYYGTLSELSGAFTSSDKTFLTINNPRNQFSTHPNSFASIYWNSVNDVVLMTYSEKITFYPPVLENTLSDDVLYRAVLEIRVYQ